MVTIEMDGTMIRRAKILGFLLAALPAGLLIATPAQAQSAGQWKDPQEIYAKICSYCHEVHVGPVLFGRGLPAGYVQATVRSGKYAMPSFRPSQISDAELQKLGEWIEASPAPKAK